MDQEHIDGLIAKVLAGEASSEEMARIEAWKKLDASNRIYADDFASIFSRASAVKTIETFDTDAAWSRLKQSIDKDPKVIPFPAPTSNRKLYWRVAAALVLAILAGTYFFSQQEHVAQPVVLSSHQETVADTLPDGSNVFLNKESSLRYAYSKKADERRVELKGEAYFNVRHDEKKPFVVDIGGVLVRDVGTAFNVRALPGSNAIEVVVEEGEVMFYTAEDSGLYLRAGAKGVYDKQLKKFTIDQPEENVLAYKTRVFNFNNAELGRVVQQLNNVYHQQIELSPSVRHCRLTVGFNQESHAEIVAIIAETLNMKVMESNGKILLDGAGCAP